MTRAGQLYLSWGWDHVKGTFGGCPPYGKVPWGMGGRWGGDWGADEAGLRARGGPMRRGVVDALER